MKVKSLDILSQNIWAFYILKLNLIKYKIFLFSLDKFTFLNIIYVK